MMKKFIACALLSASFSVCAGNTQGIVSAVTVHTADDKVFFSITSTTQNFATCATSRRYVVQTTSQQGKNILSSILAAKAAKQTVTAYGANVCTTYADAENLSYLVIN